MTEGDMITALFVVVWAGCGVAAYGLTRYSFSKQFPMLPDDNNAPIARLMAVMGPFGLLTALVMAHEYGFQFRRRDE